MLQWSLQQLSSCLRLPMPKSTNSSPRYCMELRGHRTPWPHYTRPRVPNTSRIGDWLDVLETLSQPGIKHRIRPACHYTDWAIPASAYEAATTLPVCLSHNTHCDDTVQSGTWSHISEKSIASVIKVFRDVKPGRWAIVPDVSQDRRTFICSVTSWKTWIFSSAALRTWNLTFISYVYNKVDVTCSYQTPRWHHPESHNYCESLKSQTSCIIWWRCFNCRCHKGSNEKDQWGKSGKDAALGCGSV